MCDDFPIRTFGLCNPVRIYGRKINDDDDVDLHSTLLFPCHTLQHSLASVYEKGLGMYHSVLSVYDKLFKPNSMKF
jgi:hypothetical protein